MGENISRIWHTVHLSQYHSLYPLSTLSLTDRALMFSLPSAWIWVACHRRKRKSFLKKLSISRLLSLSPPLPPSLYQLVQVIITLTAFSVFTLSLNLSSRAACCANQLGGAPITSICSALFASTLGLTGACKQAAAPPLSAKTAIFHRVVSGVTGRLSQAPHTSSSLCASPCLGLNLPQGSGRVDMTSVPQCHAQGISAVDDTDIFCNCMCVVSRDPSKGFVEMVLMSWWQCSSLVQWHLQLLTGKLITWWN